VPDTRSALQRMLREGREARELAERFGPHWSGDIAGFKSVLKSLENMGEEIHAGKVDDGFMAAHPQTNRAAIEAFRHISVHDYEKVRREIIEGIIAHHLDDTIRQLEGYVRELG
jgi:uncharacterized protein with HEPN domain